MSRAIANIPKPDTDFIAVDSTQRSGKSKKSKGSKKSELEVQEAFSSLLLINNMAGNNLFSYTNSNSIDTDFQLLSGGISALVQFIGEVFHLKPIDRITINSHIVMILEINNFMFYYFYNEDLIDGTRQFSGFLNELHKSRLIQVDDTEIVAQRIIFKNTIDLKAMRRLASKFF